MRDDKIKNYFTIIDCVIEVFNANKGLKIDTSEGGDWLVFDPCSMRWAQNGLDYLLQIFPHFDNHEKITSWTLYGAVYYDTQTDRYLTSFSPTSKVSLENIALNTERLLTETYDHISSIKKKRYTTCR